MFDYKYLSREHLEGFDNYKVIYRLLYNLCPIFSVYQQNIELLHSLSTLLTLNKQFSSYIINLKLSIKFYATTALN